jgi:hypothetical protein
VSVANLPGAANNRGDAKTVSISGAGPVGPVRARLGKLVEPPVVGVVAEHQLLDQARRDAQLRRPAVHVLQYRPQEAGDQSAGWMRCGVAGAARGDRRSRISVKGAISASQL